MNFFVLNIKESTIFHARKQIRELKSLEATVLELHNSIYSYLKSLKKIVFKKIYQNVSISIRLLNNIRAKIKKFLDRHVALLQSSLASNLR